MILLNNKWKGDFLPSLFENAEIIIPVRDENIFLKKYYLPLAELFSLEGELVTWESLNVPPVPRLYLSDHDSQITAELRFAYDQFELTYDPKLSPESIQDQSGSWILVKISRDSSQEERFNSILSSPAYGLKKIVNTPKPGLFGLRARVHPIDFLLHKVPLLASMGFEIFGEERLKTARVNRNRPSVSSCNIRNRLVGCPCNH